MPLYLYRVQPALAVAFRALYRPGEWQLSLRARSAAASVDLRLKKEQALLLRESLVAAADTYADSRFPVSRIAPCPADSPLLLLPCDLEAAAEQVKVLRHPQKRLLAIEARGRVSEADFLAEIWGTPEQLLALAEQIGLVCQQADSLCPICGLPIEGESHRCRLGNLDRHGA